MTLTLKAEEGSGRFWVVQNPHPSHSTAFADPLFIREKLRGKDKQTERDEKQLLEAVIDH